MSFFVSTGTCYHAAVNGVGHGNDDVTIESFLKTIAFGSGKRLALQHDVDDMRAVFKCRSIQKVLSCAEGERLAVLEILVKPILEYQIVHVDRVYDGSFVEHVVLGSGQLFAFEHDIKGVKASR